MNIIILAKNREEYTSGYYYPQITGMVERLIRADKEGESYVNDYLDPSELGLTSGNKKLAADSTKVDHFWHTFR